MTNLFSRCACAAVSVGALLLFVSPPQVRAQNKSHVDAPRSQQSPMQGMMQDVRQLRGLHGADLERTYLTQMLDHHQSAIDMSRMALPKTQNPGLRREEHRIISDQRQEITQMQMASLSGPQFDRAFVKEMSGHHEVAIQMSQPVIARSPHPSVRRLAAKIADGNRASQKRMHRALRTASVPPGTNGMMPSVTNTVEAQASAQPV